MLKLLLQEVLLPWCICGDGVQGQGVGPGAELVRDTQRRREAAPCHGPPALPQPHLCHPR